MNSALTYWLNDEWVGLASLPKPDLYTAGGFESILYTPEGMPLFTSHYQRLRSGLLKDFGLELLPPPSYLQEIIHALVQKNKIQQSAKIRVRVFKYGMEEAWNLLIECIPLIEDAFSWNEAGWKVSLFDIDHNQLHTSYKQVDRSVYLAASAKAKSLQVNDVLLKDQNDLLIETSIGNIFYLKDGTWHTPPLNQGGISGVMRMLLIELLNAKESALYVHDLGTIDALFICNAVRGIRWVSECDGNLWDDKYSKQAFEQLKAWQQKNSK